MFLQPTKSGCIEGKVASADWRIKITSSCEKCFRTFSFPSIQLSAKLIPRQRRMKFSWYGYAGMGGGWRTWQLLQYIPHLSSPVQIFIVGLLEASPRRQWLTCSSELCILWFCKQISLMISWSAFSNHSSCINLHCICIGDKKLERIQYSYRRIVHDRITYGNREVMWKILSTDAWWIHYNRSWKSQIINSDKFVLKCSISAPS